MHPQGQCAAALLRPGAVGAAPTPGPEQLDGDEGPGCPGPAADSAVRDGARARVQGVRGDLPPGPVVLKPSRRTHGKRRGVCWTTSGRGRSLTGTTGCTQGRGPLWPPSRGPRRPRLPSSHPNEVVKRLRSGVQGGACRRFSSAEVAVRWGSRPDQRLRLAWRRVRVSSSTIQLPGESAPCNAAPRAHRQFLAGTREGGGGTRGRLPDPAVSPHEVEVLSQRIDPRCFRHSPQSRSKTDGRRTRVPSRDAGTGGRPARAPCPPPARPAGWAAPLRRPSHRDAAVRAATSGHIPNPGPAACCGAPTA